jgi:hypothetical protein
VREPDPETEFKRAQDLLCELQRSMRPCPGESPIIDDPHAPALSPYHQGVLPHKRAALPASFQLVCVGRSPDLLVFLSREIKIIGWILNGGLCEVIGSDAKAVIGVIPRNRPGRCRREWREPDGYVSDSDSFLGRE